MFVKDLDKLNLAQELHGNRFCDFEKCCAIGIYSIEIWVGFINLRTEARNNLAIFLRDMQHLKDICILLWFGPALLGIHLKEPYLSQSAFTCSKLTIETLEQGVKCVQS